jgi:adenylate kinase family enzyme
MAWRNSSSTSRCSSRDSRRIERVVVIGTSGCGKTLFARRLAQALGCPHVELDALYWGANWRPKPAANFRRLVEAAVQGPRWIVDGNYSAVRDVVWPRATTVIWLKYGFATVLARALRRTVRRIIRREPLFAGNEESVKRSFLSRDSILLWMIGTFHEKRRRYGTLRASGAFANLEWLEFRRPAHADSFLRDMETRAITSAASDAPL